MRMTDDERIAARHYGIDGLAESINRSLAKGGFGEGSINSDAIAPIDEFHLGWRAATVEVAKRSAFERGMRIVDVGAGLGGPARYFAREIGCRVRGVDITPEYVAIANNLSVRCGLGEQAEFVVSSAARMPFASRSFDGALFIHVGMNIADKAAAFSEVHRVMKVGARVCVYDIMQVGEGSVSYPTPWASTAQDSHLAGVSDYARLLEDAGFGVEMTCDLSSLAVEPGEAMLQRLLRGDQPLLGLHLLMGADAAARFANLMDALRRSIVAPIAIMATCLDAKRVA